jgi:hypothetical protein
MYCTLQIIVTTYCKLVTLKIASTEHIGPVPLCVSTIRFPIAGNLLKNGRDLAVISGILSQKKRRQGKEIKQ